MCINVVWNAQTYERIQSSNQESLKIMKNLKESLLMFKNFNRNVQESRKPKIHSNLIKLTKLTLG